MDIQRAKQLEVGDTVFMTMQQAEDNYGLSYAGEELTISHIATSTDDHPGYDGQDGEPLFDFEELEFSLYAWEITEENPMEVTNKNALVSHKNRCKKNHLLHEKVKQVAEKHTDVYTGGGFDYDFYKLPNGLIICWGRAEEWITLMPNIYFENAKDDFETIVDEFWKERGQQQWALVNFGIPLHKVLEIGNIIEDMEATCSSD